MSQQVMKQQNTRLARRLLWAAGITNVLAFFPICCEASAMPGAGGMWLLMLLPIGFGLFTIVYATSQGFWFELGRELIWNKQCKHMGGNFAIEVPNHMRSGFVLQRFNGDTKLRVPKLREVHGTADAWTGVIYQNPGQTLEDFNKAADVFTLCFKVPFVTFDAPGDGRIHIRAGTVPVPASWAYTGHLHASQAHNNQPLLPQAVQPPQTLQAQFKQPMPKNALSLDEVPPGVLQAADDFARSQGRTAVPPVYAHSEPEPDLSYELELLKAVPMARDMHGRVCKIPIESNHWFIAARTGGGKGSWLWGLILGLIPAWKAGLVKFYGIDPKVIELAMGREFFDKYADDDQSSVELLEQAVDEMHARGRDMQGIRRKFEPSVDTPLIVVVIDEMGYLLAQVPDKKLRDRANTAIAALLNKGRAPGVACLGLLQDPRKESCNYRDGFTIRIAGGMPAPMVDLVLGEGMYDAGARCDQIPLGDAGAGVAYVISETTLKPICVRAAYPDDKAIRQAYLKAVRRVVNNDQLKTDDLSLQPGWTPQPLQQQWEYRVE